MYLSKFIRIYKLIDYNFIKRDNYKEKCQSFLKFKQCVNF